MVTGGGGEIRTLDVPFSDPLPHLFKLLIYQLKVLISATQCHRGVRAV